MTFATQFLGSAFDVDEPTVTQNIQRPFDAGARAFADRCNRLEFYAAGWFIFDFLLGKCKFYQKGCFTALLIRRNRWLPIFQPRLVDFWRAFW